MFEDFDFTLLDHPDFKEDSVREELILPILRRLGYSASPPNQITRSPTLVHPFVYIGSKKQKVHITPDYLIKRDGKSFFVLDAKHPSEDILTGRNVEQAYSYAVHKDVRTELFALCNGRKFALFHISHWPTLLTFDLQEVDEAWPTLARYIGTDAERRKVTFLPDLGIGLTYLGLVVEPQGKKIIQIFTLLDIHVVARVDDVTYSIQCHVGVDDALFLGTFDFTRNQFDSFIAQLHPPSIQDTIRSALTNHPFAWNYNQGGPAIIGIVCEIGDTIITNADEQYVPFAVREFL